MRLDTLEGEKTVGAAADFWKSKSERLNPNDYKEGYSRQVLIENLAVSLTIMNYQTRLFRTHI